MQCLSQDSSDEQTETHGSFISQALFLHFLHRQLVLFSSPFFHRCYLLTLNNSISTTPKAVILN